MFERHYTFVFIHAVDVLFYRTIYVCDTLDNRPLGLFYLLVFQGESWLVLVYFIPIPMIAYCQKVELCHLESCLQFSIP